jgi:hypothetical protein
MRFASTDLSGRGATVAHVLWEHEDVGSNPTAPTIADMDEAPGRRATGGFVFLAGRGPARVGTRDGSARG